MIDIDAVRADTVGCHERIHFNNAGSALPPRQVVDAQIEYLRTEARIGGYEMADASEERIAEVYQSAARMLGAGAGEIAITGNATESLQLAFGAFGFTEGDRILTAEAEYSSNYIMYLHTARRTGASIEVIPSDEAGQTDPEALAAMLDDRVKLITVSHMPTNGGLINPAAELGRVAEEAGIPFLLDACQTFGQLDLDVESLGCSILTATGRKYLRGPRGTGLLYVDSAILERLDPVFVDNHAAVWTEPDNYELMPGAKRFENWEFSYANVIGMGVAMDYAMGIGLEAIETRVVELGAVLRERLASLGGVAVRDIGVRKGGIVTFEKQGWASSDLVAKLHGHGINTSYTTPASTLIDATRRSLPDLVRASVHYYNTIEEIDRFCESVDRLQAA